MILNEVVAVTMVDSRCKAQRGQRGIKGGRNIEGQEAEASETG
jgi:hypothetical protein